MKKNTIKVSQILAFTSKIKKSDPAYTLSGNDLQQLVIEAIHLAGLQKEPIDNSTELMSLKDVMAVFKKSRSTIFSWKKQKVLTPVYVSGSLFFRKVDILNIINQNKK